MIPDPTAVPRCSTCLGALTLCVSVRRDGLKLWLPNAKLAENPLTNVSRSGDRWEGFKVIRHTTQHPAVSSKLKSKLSSPTAHWLRWLHCSNADVLCPVAFQLLMLA